eukprot:INCI13553.1.p1 GENE.INCI13553.1~~INCI13553.1.p1  ORF type:complete len:204 (+),score=39.33 INCI13553.1:283-894(+)
MDKSLETAEQPALGESSALLDLEKRTPAEESGRCGALGKFVVWSSIPHYFAAPLFFCPGDFVRLTLFVVVLLSTTFSILWHASSEPKNWIMYIDYSLALAWAVLELTVALRNTCPSMLGLVVWLNTMVFIFNKVTDYAGQSRATADYRRMHGYWHFMSALKSMAVAFLLGCSDNNASGSVCRGVTFSKDYVGAWLAGVAQDEL